MKKLLTFVIATLAALPLIAQTSFYPVTNQLQKGGDFYFYLSTTAGISAFEKQLEANQKELVALPNITPKNKEIVQNSFKLFFKLFRESGMNEISGIGISSKQTASGLYQRRIFYHHYPQDSSGKVWKLFGTQPHPLNSLNFLPSDTVFSMFTDVDAGNAWNWLSSTLQTCGIPKIQNGFKGMIGITSQSGVDINKLLSSIDGRIGFVVTMDNKKNTNIPMGNSKVFSLPEPKFMLVIKVKDNTIFNLIQSKTITSKKDEMNLASRSDSEGKKCLTFKMGLPFIPGPIAVLQKDGYLFIASCMDIINEALDVQSDKAAGLKSNPHFKTLSEGIPLEGNAFEFVSPRIDKVIRNLNKEYAVDAELLANKDLGMGLFSVTSVLKDGIISKCNSNYSMVNMIFSQAALVPVAVLKNFLNKK